MALHRNERMGYQQRLDLDHTQLRTMRQSQTLHCCVSRRTTTIDDVRLYSPLFLTTNAVHILRCYVLDVGL